MYRKPERKLYMDLEIKYDNGSMIVHLDEFLNCRSISKFRKLVKLINQSANPDDIGKVRMFIEQEIKQLEPRQKENERYVIGYEEKVKFCQKQLENCIYNRERFKKNSSGWQHFNIHVKQFRQELREIKTLLSSQKSDRDKYIRSKQFYVKCLENIS